MPDTMDFQSASPCKSKLRACSQCVVSLVTSAVYGAVLWHCMFSQLGIRLLPVHSLSPATSGDYHGRAIEERVAVVKAHGHSAERSHVRRFRKLQVTKNALAKVVCQAVRTCSATEPHHTLHWLPVKQRIDYNLGCGSGMDVVVAALHQLGNVAFHTWTN